MDQRIGSNAVNFGFFDDEKKEYVITRPDTPQSWSNYLGSTEYGALITNHAGGYSFYKTAARGRFLRMRFNAIPKDQPGRYFYLRDNDTSDYWSSSWQPVGKPLNAYPSICRHGTAYSIFESRYAEIETKATYFVPLGQTFEYWRLNVTNTGERPRNLSVFTFCEFTNQWDTFHDLVNLQYSLFIVRGDMTRGLLRISSEGNLQPDDPDQHHLHLHTWMALVGAPIKGFDTDRDAFIGPYRCYNNPLAVEQGRCSDSRAYGDNACGSLQTNLTLQPGESRELLVLIGIGDARSIGRKTVEEFGSPERADHEFTRLKQYWHRRLEALTVQTPDPELDHTLNVWGLYNSLICFSWSRAASLVYNGERDGLGFRDSVQDTLGVIAAIPEEARSRLELLLTGQLSSGGAMPVIRPFEHRPGQESPPDEKEYRSDDCLWFFNAVPAFVAETGDIDFYNKVLPYADHGEATVFGHLRRALEFNLERSGKNGLPCGLSADWNDCLQLGYHGESLFVAFQLRLGLTIYADIAGFLDRPKEADWALQQRNRLDRAIHASAWDKDRFIWAIGEDGTRFGTRDSEEGALYLNTQVWSVISGAATPEQAALCMESVNRDLFTPYGIMISAPPFIKTPIDIMRAVVFNPGVKENAGIFNHTQSWGVLAECLLGNGDRAYEYLRASLPAAYNDRAEVRQLEPYVQGQTTYSPYSPRPGNCRTSWLTGAASWSYYASTQYILGLRPEVDGLRIDPCIPKNWPGFRAFRRFRGSSIEIEVKNPDRVCRGVKSVIFNGKNLSGNLIPAKRLTKNNQVKVIMG